MNCFFKTFPLIRVFFKPSLVTLVNNEFYLLSNDYGKRAKKKKIIFIKRRLFTSPRRPKKRRREKKKLWKQRWGLILNSNGVTTRFEFSKAFVRIIVNVSFISPIHWNYPKKVFVWKPLLFAPFLFKIYSYPCEP